MARPLRSLLAPEGNADAEFLSVMLQRLIVELCSPTDVVVEVAEPVDVRARHAGRSPVDVIATASLDRTVDIIFAHTDGGSDWSAARRRHVEPIRSGLPGRHVVEVIPVRELEAWVLADRDAVVKAFPNSAHADAWPADPEAVRDPKAELNRIVRVSMTRRRPVRIPFRQIGERTRLSELRQLPSFRRTESDLAAALQALGFA